MIALEDIRRHATAFPEVEEATHFRLPSFKVSGRPFAGVEKGATTAVGLRVDLAKVTEARVKELVERAWRNKTRTRVVAADDAGCMT